MDTRAITTESIILRGRDYKEADRILVVLTRKFGKIPVLAKGVRKSTGKLKATSQLFSYGNLTLNMKDGFGIMTQGEILASLSELRTDLNKIACASYVGEMVDIALPDHKENEDLFLLVLTVLTLLEACEDPYMILRFFDLKLMAVLGYRPYLESCIVCGRGLSYGEFLLCPSRGGIVCKNCLAQQEGNSLSLGAIKVLDKLFTWDLPKLFHLKISREMKKEIDNAVFAYTDYYLDKSAKARAGLEQYLQLDEEHNI